VRGVVEKGVGWSFFGVGWGRGGRMGGSECGCWVCGLSVGVG